jgi:hypothetical protein
MFIDFEKIFQIIGLRVFENRVLGYTFESKRNEVRGEQGASICTAELLLFG